MSSTFGKLANRASVSVNRLKNNRDILRLIRSVGDSSPLHQLARQGDQIPQPVAFFNASTRLTGMSLNAAFSLLAALGLQMAGIPTARFACERGMSQCVLGTDRDHPSSPPPCKPCIAQSRVLFADAPTTPFTYLPNQALSSRIQDLGLEELCSLEVDPAPGEGSNQPWLTSAPLPLGRLVLPSLRWVLRRHHLLDDEPTRHIFRQYVLSAHHIAHQFSRFINRVNPQAVILFNGQFFPEATARWVSTQHGIRTITHEVGLQPFSAFFTTGEATAYPLHVPDDFALSEAQEKRLDVYLSQRFQGQFSMAGVRFWSGMHGLDEAFLKRAAGFKQIVPIFTNVIFDTSQPHSNVIFPEMFTWLDSVLEAVRQHPETLFVLRAHPDESRPGKTSRESVSQWVAQNQAEALPNLVFVDSNQSLSSYELIQRSKFVMVYNSTIGLEASLIGAPVLSAGRARYTQLPTVFFPSSQQEYQQALERFLAAEAIQVPPGFRQNARRFLYYQLFRSSLPFADFLEEDHIWPGFVKLKKFYPPSLTPAQSPAIQAIVKGIQAQGDFLLESDVA